MKILVTGSAGFIGSHIVDRLVANGDQVVGVDNLSNGKIENVNNKSDFRQSDITHYDVCRLACDGVDVVLHQAAVGSVPLSINDPRRTFDNNVIGTHNILLAAMEKNVKRVVVVGSASYYGNSRGDRTKFENTEPSPENPYACSKVACDFYARTFDKVFDIEVCVFRYFNVFGARQKENDQYSAVIPKFIHKIMNDETPCIYGDGRQSRDFTHVDNVVHANLLAAYAPKGKLGGQAFNICVGKRITLLDLVASINKILRKDIKPDFAEPRLGDIKHSLGDCFQAEKVFGYQPIVSFEHGIEKTIKWYKNKNRK